MLGMCIIKEKKILKEYPSLGKIIKIVNNNKAFCKTINYTISFSSQLIACYRKAEHFLTHFKNVKTMSYKCFHYNTKMQEIVMDFLIMFV